MSTLYKIESLEDEAAKNIAMVINKNGGRCVVACRAMITVLYLLLHKTGFYARYQILLILDLFILLLGTESIR